MIIFSDWCGWTNVKPNGAQQILWERYTSDKNVSSTSQWFLWAPGSNTNVQEAVIQSIITAPFTGPLCFEFQFLAMCSSSTSTEHKLHVYYESEDIPAPLNITDLNCPLPYNRWSKFKTTIKTNLLLGRMFIQTAKGAVGLDDIFLIPGACDKDGIFYGN